MKERPEDPQERPEAVLRSLVARFGLAEQKLFRSVRAALRKRLPTANELVYDYSSHLVLSYAPSDRGIEGIVAIDARPDGVRLHFNQGPRLPDPEGLLQGSGKQTRFVQVETARELARPEMEALIRAAIELAAVPLPTRGKGRVLLRSAGASKRQRRRPAR